MSDDISDARALLGRFLDGIADGSAGEYLGLNQAWTTLVGEDIAAHSTLVELEHGTLTVLIDHPAWHQMLDTRIGRSELIRRINARYPQLQVRRLQVRIGNLTQAQRSAGAGPRPAAQTGQPVQGGAEGQKRSAATDGEPRPPGKPRTIADPELAERLSRLEQTIRQRDEQTDKKQRDGN